MIYCDVGKACILFLFLFLRVERVCWPSAWACVRLLCVCAYVCRFSLICAVRRRKWLCLSVEWPFFHSPFPPKKLLLCLRPSLFSLFSIYVFLLVFIPRQITFLYVPSCLFFFSPQCGRVCLFPPGEKWKLLCCFPFCNGLPPPFFNDFMLFLRNSVNFLF